jgi:hypothetical protein
VTFLWEVFATNYSRIEARHPSIDFMRYPSRKCLNVAYEFLLEAYQFDGDGFKSAYGHIFDPESDQFDMDAHSDGRIGG